MNGHKILDLEESIIPTITSNLAPVIQDGAEVLVDAIFEEGTLRDLPVVGALVALAKVHRSVRDRMYLKKMLRFLGPLSEASVESRLEFVETTLSSSEERERFSETVVNLVERADSSMKTDFYGRLFLAHIKRIYEYEDVLKLCSMIDRSFWSDLLKLPLFMTAETEDNLLTETLYKNGFLSLSGLDGGTFSISDSGGAVYKINWYGEQVVHMLREIKEDKSAS